MQDNSKETVAMYLASDGKKIPTQWEHCPMMINNYRWTVAPRKGDSYTMET